MPGAAVAAAVAALDDDGQAIALPLLEVLAARPGDDAEPDELRRLSEVRSLLAEAARVWSDGATDSARGRLLQLWPELTQTEREITLHLGLAFRLQRQDVQRLTLEQGRRLAELRLRLADVMAVLTEGQPAAN